MISGCRERFINPWPDVPLDTAARAAHWGGLPYPEGTRYVCPEHRRPQPKATETPLTEPIQLDLFGESS